MKHTITRQQMEVFAQLLETVKQQKTLSTEEFDHLHAQFHGKDAGGSRWTIGIHTRTWNRREQGRWVASAAPEELQMEEEIVTALWELLSKQWAAGGPTPQRPSVDSPRPGAETAVCSRCGSALKPDNRFCPSCGGPTTAVPTTPVPPAERRCSRCGHVVPAGKKFCTTCGAPL
jgi:RNA polymerase subunit RPABC4/transcription elongation factor Spt4